MKNRDLVLQLFQILQKMNIYDVIVCAGARNLPIVLALENSNFKVSSYFEERSAGFFAVGKVKVTDRPVAVITTSGTAVAELLPAVIEAHYQSLPLIVISADRPKGYRGTGSPQSIEQVGLLSSYVECVYDWDIHTTEFTVDYSGQKPIHFNICFDEPLIEHQLSEYPMVDTSGTKVHLKPKSDFVFPQLAIQNPVAIISELKFADRNFVSEFLIENNIVHYAEFLSGLKNRKELMHLQIQSSEYFVKSIFSKNKSATVLRIGGIPTLRFWRDLESEFKDASVISFSNTTFSGLFKSSQLYSLQHLNKVKVKYDIQFELAQDLYTQEKKYKLLSEFKMSEPSIISELSNHVQQKATYLGNSLPIRMWDSFSFASQAGQPVYANRGANGIDGQVSTYLGWAEHQNESWCVVGDLTALYDLASLGLVKAAVNKYRICVMNNSGGQIFNRLFGNEKYLNAQNVQFKSWAEMWAWDYLKISEPADFIKLSQIQSDKIIIEFIPDHLQTKLFWQKWDLCIQ